MMYKSNSQIGSNIWLLSLSGLVLSAVEVFLHSFHGVAAFYLHLIETIFLDYKVLLTMYKIKRTVWFEFILNSWGYPEEEKKLANKRFNLSCVGF